MCTHSTHTGLVIIYREQGKPICKAANDEAEARSRGETPGTSRERGSLQLLIPFPSPGWGLGGIFHARILPIKGNSLLLKSVKWFVGFCLVSYWSKQLLTSLAHIFQSNLALFFFFFPNSAKSSRLPIRRFMFKSHILCRLTVTLRKVTKLSGLQFCL